MHLLPNALNRRIHFRHRSQSQHEPRGRKHQADIEKDGDFRQRALNDGPRDESQANDRLFDPLLQSADQQEANSTKFRLLPIFSGIMVPFAVMLAIPGLTGHWYVRTDETNMTVETQDNPIILDVGMYCSLVCGVLANVCLVLRFAERSIRWMTLGAIAFLTIHDLINIPAVTWFGVVHHVDDGFTYGQPFWFTVCSTIASTATNVTLVIDMIQTQDFVKSGSGLTSKQRSLVVITIIMLTYISFGALIQTNLQGIDFINALYFSVVSIETIGFGDIPLVTTKAKVFTCFYIAGGLLNIALAVTMARDALLEAAVINFRARRRMHERERRLRDRWRAAVRWRLRSQGRPVWIHHRQHGGRGCTRWKAHQWYKWFIDFWDNLSDGLAFESDDPSWRFLRGPRHRRLNVEALTDSQLHAAALEAGAPLMELVPAELGIPRDQPSEPQGSAGLPISQNPVMDRDNDPALPLTHFRLGAMLSLIGNFAVAVTHANHERIAHDPPPSGVRLDAHMYSDSGPGQDEHDEHDDLVDDQEQAEPQSGVPALYSSTTIQEDERSMVERLEDDEQNAFYTRLIIALVLFVTFWMGGAAIFMNTERWSFGIAVYFCFVSFTTVGYGDFSPKTPAGRSIFVVWALMGVATVTILISVISEAYSTRYKSIILSEVYQATAENMGLSSPLKSKPNTATTRLPYAPSVIGDNDSLRTGSNDRLARKKPSSLRLASQGPSRVASPAHDERTLRSAPPSRRGSIQMRRPPALNLSATPMSSTVQEAVLPTKAELRECVVQMRSIIAESRRSSLDDPSSQQSELIPAMSRFEEKLETLEKLLGTDTANPR